MGALISNSAIVSLNNTFRHNTHTVRQPHLMKGKLIPALQMLTPVVIISHYSMLFTVNVY